MHGHENTGKNPNINPGLPLFLPDYLDTYQHILKRSIDLCSTHVRFTRNLGVFSRGTSCMCCQAHKLHAGGSNSLFYQFKFKDHGFS